MVVSAKNKILLMMALIFLAGMAWYILLYQPKRSALERIKSEIVAMGQRIKSLTVSEEELKTLEQEIEGIQGEISQIERRIYPKTQLPPIVRQIRQKGRIHNLHFRAVIPSYDVLLPMGEDQGQSPLIKLPMEFRLEGRYLNFGRFLEKVDQYPFIFNVTDVDINFNKEIYPRLDIRMSGCLYLRQEDSEKSLSLH